MKIKLSDKQIDELKDEWATHGLQVGDDEQAVIHAEMLFPELVGKENLKYYIAGIFHEWQEDTGGYDIDDNEDEYKKGGIIPNAVNFLNKKVTANDFKI